MCVFMCDACVCSMCVCKSVCVERVCLQCVIHVCVMNVCVFKCAEAGGACVCDDWIAWVVCIINVYDQRHKAYALRKECVCEREKQRKGERLKGRKRECV